jgi:hypothetical protein
LSLVAGLAGLELLSRTDVAAYPYTFGKETLELSLTRDWLTVGGGYSFTVLPIGITSATLFAQAAPPHLLQGEGDLTIDLGIEGEARQKGDSLADISGRTELWLKGSVAVIFSNAVLDQVAIGASLEGTGSAPGDLRVWPVAKLFVSGKEGCVSFRSEAAVSLSPLRFDSERVTLELEPFSGALVRAEVAFVPPTFAPAAELGFFYEFGDPGRAALTKSCCVGGVCTDGF